MDLFAMNLDNFDPPTGFFPVFSRVAGKTTRCANHRITVIATLGEASSARREQHFRKALSLTAELHPWLSTVAKDLHRQFNPAHVVERSGQNHRDIRHDLGLVNER